MSKGSAADLKALIDRIEKLEKDMKDLKGENSILKRQSKELDEDDATKKKKFYQGYYKDAMAIKLVVTMIYDFILLFYIQFNVIERR
jgi:cell division protein FtsB